jgi:hypothetical protein
MKKTECFESNDGKLWKTQQEAKEQDFRAGIAQFHKTLSAIRDRTYVNIGTEHQRTLEDIVSKQEYWEYMIPALTNLLNMAIQLLPQYEALRQDYEKR